MKPYLQNTVRVPRRFFLSAGAWALLFCFIMVFIMGLLKIYSPDLGFHLKSAQWMLDNRQFIYTDSFSLGSEGNRYFNLQWLFQLFVYTLYNRGESVLVIVNALLITASLVLLWFRFFKYAGVDNAALKKGFFAFIMVLFVQPMSFEIRPQVLSWLFLNLVLIALESYKKGNRKSLYALPVIMLVWVNTHSLAILGLVTIAIYNAGACLEKRKIDKPLLAYSGLTFASFLVNPYLLDGLFFSLSQFGIISGDTLFKSYLGELQSPFTSKEISLLGARYFTSPLLIIHLSALLSVFSIFRAVVQKQFTDALLLAAFLVLLYLAHRNYSVFALVSLPLFVKYLLSWIESRKERKQKLLHIDKKKSKNKEEDKINTILPINKKLHRKFAYTAIFIATFVSVTSITDGYRIFTHSPNRFGFTADKDQLPVEATAFLNRNHVKGKLLNHLDFGGYLMAHYSEKTFIDGRMELFGEAFFRKYYESLTIGKRLKSLLNEYDPDIVIFPYVKASYWWGYFVSNKNRSGYRPVYFDGLAVIYLKSSVSPQLPEITENNILAVIDHGATGRLNHCIESSKPKGLMVLINGLWQKQSFAIAEQNKATYCFTNQFDTAAINYSVMGIENSTVQTPNIFKNLSIYYMDHKLYNEAQRCEDKSE